LAYLHPKYFTPDPSVLDELGLTEKEKYTIVRFVSWGASHDRGQKGITLEFGRQLVGRLSEYGQVFISAEGALPAEFEPYRLRLPAHRMHDALAFAHLYIGEGATMASEAAILGTPAIYINSLLLGYLEELEQEYGLVQCFMNTDSILPFVEVTLANEAVKTGWCNKRHQLLADKIDVTEIICEQISKNMLFKK
jgi:predicted glycosyltransferase